MKAMTADEVAIQERPQGDSNSAEKDQRRKQSHDTCNKWYNENVYVCAVSEALTYDTDVLHLQDSPGPVLRQERSLLRIEQLQRFLLLRPELLEPLFQAHDGLGNVLRVVAGEHKELTTSTRIKKLTSLLTA